MLSASAHMFVARLFHAWNDLVSVLTDTWPYYDLALIDLLRVILFRHGKDILYIYNNISLWT